MRKALQLILFTVFTSYFSFAQIPAGYYNGTEGLEGDQLKQALHSIISGHTELNYDDLPYVLKQSDEDPANSNNVILLYTGRSQSKSTFGGGVDDWNREHVWAKSHGGFSDSKPYGTDAHHIRPTDASVNSSRGNLDFDNGGSYHSEATLCRYDGDSWEPRDAVKGDVARMMFYMDVRYEGGGELNLDLVDYVGTDGTPTFGKISTLLAWHHADPVDDFERNRNDVVYSFQGNRNPFIDRPEFVGIVYEGQSAGIEDELVDVSLSLYPNPVSDVLYVSAPQILNRNAEVEFINAIGQSIKKYTIVDFTRKAEIDVRNLDPGAYFIKFNSGKISRVSKIVVDR